MGIYLVDYENVHNDGVTDIQKLSASSLVFVSLFSVIFSFSIFSTCFIFLFVFNTIIASSTILDGKFFKTTIFFNPP